MNSGELPMLGDGGAPPARLAHCRAAAVAFLRFFGPQGEPLGERAVAAPPGATQLILKVAGCAQPGTPPRRFEIALLDNELPGPETGALLALGTRSWGLYDAGGLRLKPPIEGIICTETSPLLTAVERLRRLAASSMPIIVLGEKGVGKTALLRVLHQLSGRLGKFNHANCADFALTDGLAASVLFGLGRNHGLPNAPAAGTDGLLERSHNGTLLLDDFDLLPLSTQGALLLVVESQAFRKAGGQNDPVKVDVRFVFATNKDPRELVAKDLLRGDFYDRISTMEIRVPPLRERRQDIPALIAHFSQRDGQKVRYAPDLFLAMLWHDWPDNVRGLENFIRGTFVWAAEGPLSLAELENLPFNPGIVAALRAAYSRYEKAAKRENLDSRQEQIATLILAAGGPALRGILLRAATTDEILGETWLDLIKHALNALRDQLASLGFHQSALQEADNCREMLQAGGLGELTIRRLLYRVLRRLRDQGVPLSSRHEPRRYATLERFFGLRHDQLRYYPRRRTGGANS